MPLAFIAAVSVGTHDRFGRVLFDALTLDNYRKAFAPTFLPTISRSVYYAAMTTILSIAIGYPMAYWISRYGGRNKALLLILVMLPFWTSYLIRTYAWMIILRDNGVVNSILQGLGITSEPIILLNTDLAVILGHDLRVPAVRDPALVRVDRPAGRRARLGRARPVRERPEAPSCTSSCR